MITEHGCQAFGEKLSDKAAPGWEVPQADLRAWSGEATCWVGLRNTTLKHSVVKPRDAFLKGAIAEIASRDLIALDVPLSGIGSFEKWMSNMSWCQCRNFAAHPHYVTEEGHDWFEIGEDAMPQGLLPALRETIKERGPPTAIHARCITSRDQRYCVAENALKET